MGILCTLFGHKVTTGVSHVQLDGHVSPFMDYVKVSTACSRCGEPIVLGHLKRPAEWTVDSTSQLMTELGIDPAVASKKTWSAIATAYRRTGGIVDPGSTVIPEMLRPGESYHAGGTPSHVDGVVGGKVIFKPWYPDDSGEWVEIAHFRELMRLPVATTVEVLCRSERQRKHYIRDLFVAGEHDLYVSLSAIVAYKIVAYKIVK